MEAKEIRDLSAEEIQKRIEEEEEQLDQLRFRHAITGRLDNPMVLRTKRRDIARLKTILNEKTHQEEA